MCIHKCPVLGRTCCQSPIRPKTLRRDIIDLLYQGGSAATAPSTLRPSNISCLRADVLPEPRPPCDLYIFPVSGRRCCQSPIRPATF